MNSWAERTKIYRARKKSGANVRVRLDLTKRRLNLLDKINNISKQSGDKRFAFSDVNCRLGIMDEGGKAHYFNTLDDFSKILDNLNE